MTWIRELHECAKPELTDSHKRNDIWICEECHEPWIVDVHTYVDIEYGRVAGICFRELTDKEFEALDRHCKVENKRREIEEEKAWVKESWWL